MTAAGDGPVLGVKRTTRDTLIQAEGGIGARVTRSAGTWGFWSSGKRYGQYDGRGQAEAAASEFVAVASAISGYLAGYRWATISDAAVRDMADVLSPAAREALDWYIERWSSGRAPAGEEKQR